MTTATQLPTIHVTEQAAKQMMKIAAKEGYDEFGLRMAVKGGGCSGLTYKLGFTETPKKDDKSHRGTRCQAFHRLQEHVLPGRHRSRLLRRAERQGFRVHESQRQDDLRVRELLLGLIAVPAIL